MPGKVEFKIHGAKEMENLLLQLGPTIAVKVAKQAARAGARPIINDARARVRKRSRNLERGIIAVAPRAWNDRPGVLIGFSKDPVADPRRKSGVDIVSRRAHLEEFGTSKQAAKPFLRPALDAKAGDALSEMGKVLGQGIEREAKKLAKPR